MGVAGNVDWWVSEDLPSPSLKNDIIGSAPGKKIDSQNDYPKLPAWKAFFFCVNFHI